MPPPILIEKAELRRLQAIEKQARRFAGDLRSDAAEMAKVRGAGAMTFISHAKARDLLEALAVPETPLKIGKP